MLQSLVYRFERYTQKPIQIALYHRVGPIESQNDLGLKVSPDVFEKHLQYYKKHFQVHFVDDLIQNQFQARNEHDFAITFDDGYGDNFKYMFPLIKKYEVPVTIFITTAFIESNLRMLCDKVFACSQKDTWPETEKFTDVAQRLRFLKHHEIDATLASIYGLDDSVMTDQFMAENAPLNWEEVKEMKDSGLVRFEPHGHQHINLSVLSDEEVKEEIQLSIDLIKKKLNYKSKVFAYPFGSVHDINHKTPEIIKSFGLEAAFLASGRSNTRFSDPFRLDRLSCCQKPVELPGAPYA